jgi:hypothetical protein
MDATYQTRVYAGTLQTAFKSTVIENKLKVTSVHTVKAYEELDVGFSHP